MRQAIARRLLLFRRREGSVRLSRSRAGTFGIFIFMAIVSVFMALPILYSVIQAFKPLDEIFAYPPRFFVRNPTLDNFRQVMLLADNLWVPFTRYLFNSLAIAIGGTIVYVIISSLAAYPLAKTKLPGMSIISTLIVWTLLFNGDVTAMPRYMIISALGMVNTYWAVVLPALSGTMGVFLMRQFIVSAIPDSTLEAARIDGAGEFHIFSRVVMPSIKPAWMTVVIFGFQAFWNANVQNYIYSENLKPLQAVLTSITAGGIARAGASAAVTIIMMIPPIVIFLISQSSVVETMAHSGLK